MNCYDCATIGDRSSAVATCVDCGAGLCLDHLVLAEHHLTRVALINRIEIIEPAARLMYCETCTAARDAIAHRPAVQRVAAS